MPGSEIKDKQGEPIHKGDTVWTPFRGGKRQGTAEKIVTTEAEARQEGVKNPPKVLCSPPKLGNFEVR